MMSYPPETSRSCHEADGRSDRSGGSGGAAGSSSGGVYGSLCGSIGKWPLNSSVGSCPTSASHDRLVSNWKRWSLGLDHLLQDSEGVALFKSYLQYEGCSHLLDFWFACQGFRSKVDPSDNRKIAQLTKAIYRTYIRGSSTKQTALASASPLPTSLSDPQMMTQIHSEPIRLRTETRKLIAERISRRHALDQTVFDPAQSEVEHFLRTTAYPAFLKSDVYVDFLQSTLDGSFGKFDLNQSGSWTGFGTASPMNPFAGLPEFPATFLASNKTLPTLEEDHELKSEEICGHGDFSRRSVLPISSCTSADVQATFPSPQLNTQQQQLQLNHCPRCSQYHLQGHQNACQPYSFQQHSCNVPPFTPEGVFSSLHVPSYTGTAPLTVENLQRTRFYRTDLSVRHTFVNSVVGPTRFSQLRGTRPENPYQHVHETKSSCPRSHLNYAYSQWVDAICPLQPSVPSPDSRLTTHIPSQPPNPYHISYAPVSARDSERHSLSSETRTDDNQSHANSSHEDATTSLRQCSYAHRCPDHIPPSRTSGQQPSCQHPRDSSKELVDIPRTSIASPVPTKPARSNYDDFTHPHRTIGHEGNVLNDGQEPIRSQSKHQRNSTRRGLSSWRGTDRGKYGVLSGTKDSTNDGAAAFRSSSRSHNLAEKDPHSFFQLLSSKLQRVLDSQLASERLDRIMTESSPSRPHSTEEPEELSPKSAKPTEVHVSTSVKGNSISYEIPHSSSLLQRPWADRLLAAARVQHANTRDNAQAILEDHCSRIWAASADRTPTSSGSGSGGAGTNMLVVENSSVSNGDPSAAESGRDCPEISDVLTGGSCGVSFPTVEPPPGRKKHSRTLKNERLLSARSPRPLNSARAGTAVSHQPQSVQAVLPQTNKGPKSGTDVGVNWTESTYVDMNRCNYIQSPRSADDHMGKVLHTKHYSESLSNRTTASDHTCDTSESPQTGAVSCDPVVTLDKPSKISFPLSISASIPPTSSSSTTTSALSASTSGLPASSPGSSSPRSLVIGYYLGDDPVPYRSVWPAAEITLGQFKQLIPKKKGSFRYFFKKFSDEFDSGVVHQEITNDYCTLPLWEGKVVAKVERIE